MKQRTIRIRMYDSLGVSFPQLASPVSTKPKVQVQPRTADKPSSFADINEIHRAFWAENGQ